MWTTPVPEGSTRFDLEDGRASLRAENICSVFDAFTVGNSFSPSRPLGFVSGIIESVEIEMSGIKESHVGFSDPKNQFAGDFFELSFATIAVTAVTPVSTGHGFRFVSDPASTVVNFAQVAKERNGVFF